MLSFKLLVKEAADLSIIPNKVIKIKKPMFPLTISHNNIRHCQFFCVNKSFR